MIFRIHERPDPKRVLEFEEIATQFGYSLRAGAAPVKKFRETQKSRWRSIIPISPRAIIRNWSRRSRANPRSAS